MKVKIYLTNLGRYNEGHLVGKWVTLPVADIEETLEEIGVKSDTRYEEYFITDYESPFAIAEYEDLERLNDIAEQIEEFEEGVDGLREMLSFIGYENFEELDYQENDDETLERFFYGKDPWAIACAVHHGKWSSGHDLVKLDGRENLVSKNRWEVDEEINRRKEDIINAYLEEVLA